MEPGRDASEIGPSHGLGAAPAYAGTIRHVRSDTLGSNVSATSATEMLPRTAEESVEAVKTECVVCLSAEPVMALMPCGHRCACADCAPSLSLCPICRSPVQEAKRIFG